MLYTCTCTRWYQDAEERGEAVGATGRPQPLCHQETGHHCEYRQSSRLLQGYRVSMGGGANTGISQPDSIMASGLAWAEGEGRSLNVQSQEIKFYDS